MERLREYLMAQLSLRRDYLRENQLEAFRLCAGNHYFPCAVDIYGDNAVIHVFSSPESNILKQMENWLNDELNVTACFYKDRTKNSPQLPNSAAGHKEDVVGEYGHKFLINLSDYLDVGLFLDHRETRKWMGEKCRGKTVLNTFAYTGSFSVYAAAGGAEKTYSVDLSKTYCDWIKKNLELNNLPPERNWVYKMDTMEFFKYAARKDLKFDIIIIDPPTFSKNKKKNFSVQRDHPEMINAALELLNPEGFIMFSNNCRDFRLEASEINSHSIKNLDLVPPDFVGSKPHKSFIIRN